MRYVPIKYIKEDMVLAKTLYGYNGEILLTIGVPILSTYIKKLYELGFAGLYIKDKLSEDITVADVISEELKMKTINSLRSLMRNNISKQEIQASLKIIGKQIVDIVDEISINEDTMINMVNLKVASEYTFYHCVDVCVLSIVLGVALNFNKEDLYLLGTASLLHDVGKIYTPNDILDKPGKLTYEEFQIIKKHSGNGYKYVKENLNINDKVYTGIYQHHERYDGTGYPLNIKGKEISLFGRIIAIADVYDALISDRPYRKGVLPSDAIEFIMGSSDSMFDQQLVKTFCTKLAPYPIGTCVKLSNGLIGIVVENYSSNCLRPSVKVIQEDNELVEPYLINLKQSDYNVTIIGLADALLFQWCLEGSFTIQ